MSTSMYIFNQYATKNSQTKFKNNHIKIGKVTVLKVVEEEQGEEEKDKQEEE